MGSEMCIRDRICIAWESGFAAISSLIDHAIQKDENRSIDLYWLSAIPRGHYLSNYCRAWRDALDDFRYHSIDREPVGGERLEAMIERVARVHVSLASCDYYLILPENMIEPAQRILREVGVADDRIRMSALKRA